MKKLQILILSFVLVTINLSAQIVIEGSISFNNKPIESATVYLNNTSIGTITNTNGEFSLEVNEGEYQLIISYIGLKKIEYALDTSKYDKPLTFLLAKEEFVLDEIVVTNKKNDRDRPYHLSRFISAFIGTGDLSKQCKIKNPDVLFFDYDKSKRHLTAEAYEPLIVENKTLGYKIHYDLKYFSLDNKYVKYLGYTYFKEFKGKQKRWQKNRLKAYLGSQRHFYKSVLENTTKEEGFIIHQFARKHRTKEEIRKEQEAKNPFKGTFVSNFNPIKESERIDGINVPKYKDYLYKSDMPSSDIVVIEDNIPYLQFKDNIIVVYTKEKEERSYIIQNGETRKRYPQTSNVLPLTEKTAIHATGILANPLSVIYEGYWGYEKFAYTLPLDYKPIIKK